MTPTPASVSPSRSTRAAGACTRRRATERGDARRPGVAGREPAGDVAPLRRRGRGVLPGQNRKRSAMTRDETLFVLWHAAVIGLAALVVLGGRTCCWVACADRRGDHGWSLCARRGPSAVRMRQFRRGVTQWRAAHQIDSIETIGLLIPARWPRRHGGRAHHWHQRHRRQPRTAPGRWSPASSAACRSRSGATLMGTVLQRRADGRHAVRVQRGAVMRGHLIARTAAASSTWTCSGR